MKPNARKKDAMKKHESLNEELESLSPWLREQSRKPQGMQVPPGYFENLEDAVFSKIDAQDARRPALSGKPGGLLRTLLQPRMWAAAAAVSAIAIACWWMFRPQTSAVLPVDTYAETLTDEEIEAYVLDNITEFDSEQLASITEEDLTEHAPAASPSPTPSVKTPDDIPDEELENLLQHMSEEELESLL